MKIKVSFGNDLRLFKYDGASLLEALDGLNTFIETTFGVNEFRLQYRDEEDDLVTLSSENELDEALDVASEQGKTLKVFVVAAVARQDAGQVEEEPEEPPSALEPATELKSDVPPPVMVDDQVVEENENEEPQEEEHGGAANIHDLAKLLMDDEAFRQEFAAFAQDVVIQLREGDEFETAVRTALVSHEDLSSHPFMGGDFLNMLPLIGQRAQFFLPMMKTIEPTEVPGMIDRAVNAMKQGEQMMPMLMNMCGGPSNGAPGACAGGPFGGFGGMPFFGGGFGPHQGMNGACNPHAGQGGHGPPGHHPHHGMFGHHHGFGRGHGRGHRRGRGRGRSKFAGGSGRCGKKSREFGVDIVDSDVTVADRAVVLPKTTVVKTWRIRNSGEEAFPEGTKLKYVGRPFNQLVDGVEFPVESIAPGEEGEVSILLSTPEEGGRYGSAWRFQLPDGSSFGPMLRARVIVAGEEEKSSDSSDDMADVYDTVPRRELKRDKKARKLNKMLEKREKLEAQLARLSSKIEATEEALSGLSSANEEEQLERPIVSTLVTAGGDLEDDDDDQDQDDRDVPVDDGSATVALAAEDDEPDVFANELAELENMGFSDTGLNRLLLRQHNGQLEPVLNTLCELRA